MPKFVHVFTGPDGNSVIEEKEFEMTKFTDTEGAHGLASPIEQTPGISFRLIEAGYFLDFHTAPRRQYSISLTGSVELGLPVRPPRKGSPPMTTGWPRHAVSRP